MEKTLLITAGIILLMICGLLIYLKISRIRFKRETKQTIKEAIENGEFTQETGDALEWIIFEHLKM